MGLRDSCFSTQYLIFDYSEDFFADSDYYGAAFANAVVVEKPIDFVGDAVDGDVGFEDVVDDDVCRWMLNFADVGFADVDDVVDEIPVVYRLNRFIIPLDKL